MGLRRNVQSVEQLVHLDHARHVELFVGIDLVFRRGSPRGGRRGHGLLVAGFHLGQKGVDFRVALPGLAVVETLHVHADVFFDAFGRGDNSRRGLAFFYQFGEVDDFFISLSNFLGNHANLMGLTERRACAGAGGPPLHSVSAGIDAWKNGQRRRGVIVVIRAARAETKLRPALIQKRQKNVSVYRQRRKFVEKTA